LPVRRVFVTGLGMLTGVGANMQQSFQALLAGCSAVTEAPPLVTRWLPKALAACVKDPIDRRLTRAEASLDRATQLGLLAAREAISDAAFASAAEDKHRVGIYVGIGMAGAQTLDAFYTSFHERLPRCEAEGRDPTVVHPLAVPRIMANSTASLLSIENGFQGPTHTYSVACSSSAVAIGEAYRAIQSGRLDAALAVGTESLRVFRFSEDGRLPYASHGGGFAARVR